MESKTTVLVTGGARGMGAAQSKALAAHGHHVAVCDLLDADGIALVEELESAGYSASYHHLDVSDSAAWDVLVAKIVAEQGGLFGLVNNAGVPLRTGLMATSDEDWRRVMAVNLDGCFYGLRAVGPAIRDSGGGSIVNISSIAGQIGYHATGYAASKWGLTGLTKSAALEFAPWGIRVNSVHPGLVNTPLMQQADPIFIEETIRATPVSRAGETREIADVVAFLMSPGSTYMTGTEVTVDGGLTAAGTYWQITENVAARR